jgi:hypothetical protein
MYVCMYARMHESKYVFVCSFVRLLCVWHNITLSTTNPTGMNDLDAKMGRRREKPATDNLSYGTVINQLPAPLFRSLIFLIFCNV